MTIRQFCCLLTAAIVANQVCHAATTPRRQVSSLPGYGAPPTRHWTGFVEVDVSSGTHLFYYLVESQKCSFSESACTAPLIMYMNGGPGASSLASLFSEEGPLLFTDNLTLISNPYSWNREAHLLYVEFGPGVGYSYCDNSSLPTGANGCAQSNGTCSPCAADDHSVALQNTVLLRALLEGDGKVPAVFPELSGVPFFVAGESYAGVYGPTLVQSLIVNLQNTNGVNLTGVWLTDPCTDNGAQFGWLDLGVDFSWQKGLLSTELYSQLVSPDCTVGRTPNGDRVRGLHTQACVAAWRQYDIATNGIGDAQFAAPIPGLPFYIDPLNAYGPSGGPDAQAYFASAAVRKALFATYPDDTPNKVYHIALGNNGYLGYTQNYLVCNNRPDYSVSKGSMVDIYRWVVNATLSGVPSASSLRTLIISSGNIDPVVSLHGTEAAVHKIGFPVDQQGRASRRVWFFNASATPLSTLANKPAVWGQSLHADSIGPQIGGFTTSFDTGDTSRLSLHFVSVRASGHVVPAYAPARALHVITRLLLKNKMLTPLLPQGWDTVDDKQWYARGGTSPGLFAQWALLAMTPAFTAS